MKNLREMVRGRTVALVGNASSIFEKKRGPEIDSQDIVVRMNAGFVTSPESQGTRTDVWVTSLAVPVEDVENRFNPRIAIWATSKRSLLPSEYRDASFDLLLHPLARWIQLRLSLGARPSTGAIIANYLANFCAPELVTTYGFDHFQTKTFYSNSLRPGPHSASAEAAFFDALYSKHSFIPAGG